MGRPELGNMLEQETRDSLNNNNNNNDNNNNNHHHNNNNAYNTNSTAINIKKNKQDKRLRQVQKE